MVTTLDLTPYRSSAHTLLVGSLALDAVMLACAYALTRLAVGRALRPVRAMTDQAAQWSAVASGERFGSTRHPAELAALGASLDSILDRIRSLLRHEQQLTGELSHELRTPLSRIIAELDWWQTRPRTAAQTRATHQVIGDAAESMRTICDTLLADAREHTPTAPGIAEVVPTLRRLAELLDVPAHLTITVEGPHLTTGIPPARLERIAGHLFEPGRRANPDDGHSGAGLGLPLARRLARSAGGEVSYDEGHALGARFVITLPPGGVTP